MKSSRDKKTGYKKTSIPPLAVRYCHYTEKYLVPRLRAERDPPSAKGEGRVSDNALVAEAAKNGDREAACAMFLELWRALASKKIPDQEVFDYFEPKLLQVALHGMSHGLREEGEPISKLGDLDSLFNVKRKPDEGNLKGAGEKPGKLRSRDLDIVSRVDKRCAEIVESGQESHAEALKVAFVFVEEDIKDTQDAIKAEQIETICKKEKEFSDQINKEGEEYRGRWTLCCFQRRPFLEKEGVSFLKIAISTDYLEKSKYELA